MPLLENKVCVVTGGAGSIGLASARLFLREGAKVAGSRLKHERARTRGPFVLQTLPELTGRPWRIARPGRR